MAHPDLNELMNALLPFAQQMLAKHGEFFPFGASMNHSGEIKMLSTFNGSEHPASNTLIDFYIEAFHHQSLYGDLRSAGICYDIHTIPPGKTEKYDAICISLEHQSGEAVDVFVPYTKEKTGKIQYSDIFTSRRTPKFFSE